MKVKIAFSTLACPDWAWSDIYSMAKDFKFDGIELRGLGNEIFSVKAKPFTDEQLPATVEKLRSLNLERYRVFHREPVSNSRTDLPRRRMR